MTFKELLIKELLSVSLDKPLLNKQVNSFSLPLFGLFWLFVLSVICENVALFVSLLLMDYVFCYVK